MSLRDYFNTLRPRPFTVADLYAGLSLSHFSYLGDKPVKHAFRDALMENIPASDLGRHLKYFDRRSAFVDAVEKTLRPLYPDVFQRSRFIYDWGKELEIDIKHHLKEVGDVDRLVAAIGFVNEELSERDLHMFHSKQGMIMLNKLSKGGDLNPFS